jgi:hypothetical protein
MKLKDYPVVLMAIILLLAGCTPNGGVEPTAPSLAAPPAELGTLAATQPTPTIALPAGPRAAIVELINQVEAHPLPDGDWQLASVAMTIYTGGEVWAKESATARIQLDESMIRVAPNTIFTLKPATDQTVTLDLAQGQVWLNVEGLAPGETLEVQTPDAVAAVRGTRFSVRVLSEGGTIVSTREGAVAVTAAGSTVLVEAGTQSTVLPGSIPGEPAPLSIPELGLWGMATDPHLSVAFPAVRELVSLTGPGIILDPAWSPDNQLAFQLYDPAQPDKSSHWETLDPGTGQPIVTSLYGESDGLNFNPGGQIAYLSYQGRVNRICTRPTLTSPTETCFIPDVPGVGWPFWSPDGQWILFYAGSGSSMNLYRSRPDGSELLQLTHWTTGVAHRQTWSPDSRQVAYIYSPSYGEDGQLWVVNLDGTHSPDAVLLENVFGDGQHVAWSSDGTLLAVPVAGAGIWLVETGRGIPWQIPATAAPGEYRSVEWSQTPTGWPLIYRHRSSDADPWVKYVLLSDQAEPYALGEVQWGPIWSPDGSVAVLGSNIQTDPAINQYEYHLTVLGVELDFLDLP